MITERQNEALQFIIQYQAEKGGVSPTLSEIAVALKCKSRGHVHWLLSSLEDRGRIRRLRRRERAIEVIPDVRHAVYRFDDELKELVPFKPARHSELFKGELARK